MRIFLHICANHCGFERNLSLVDPRASLLFHPDQAEVLKVIEFARLSNYTILDEEYLIRIFNGAQPMRYAYDSHSAFEDLANALKGCLNVLLCPWVECRGSLVEDQQLRLLYQCSCDSDSLFLSS